MIDDDTLLGYALDALEPAEREAVREQLLSDTASMIKLDRVTAILRPLAIDREAPVPPPDLIANTLARLDASFAEPKRASVPSRKWLELAVAASIGLLGFGIVATGISKWHDLNAQAGCSNNLRGMYAGLEGYANKHGDRYPQTAKAGDFHAALAASGHWPEGVSPRCAETEPVGYAYALGHRDAAGTLIGPSRQVANRAQTPIVADFPSRFVNANGPVSPHNRVQNVLFVDGHTMPTTSPNVGPNGDNIYLNDAGLRHAGLHAGDAFLGRPDDEP